MWNHSLSSLPEAHQLVLCPPFFFFFEKDLFAQAEQTNLCTVNETNLCTINEVNEATSIHCSAKYVLKVIFMKFSFVDFPPFLGVGGMS